MKFLKFQQRTKNLILAYSHGRNIAPKLAEVWPDRSSRITYIFKQNANIAQVTKTLKHTTESFRKEGCVIIISGSNDNIVSEESQLIDTFKKLIKLVTHTTIIVAGLQNQYNSPGFW